MHIYVVTHKPSNVRRLVRAKNRDQARNHVVAETIHAEKASQDVLLELAGAGTKVEDFKDSPAE